MTGLTFPLFSFALALYSTTFVSHDCNLHSGFFQHPQALSLTAVLYVTEVEAGYKDPKAKVGCLAEELGQCA